MLKKAKRFARRNVQKATDVLLPSGSSLGGGRRRGGDGGPVRFTPPTPLLRRRRITRIVNNSQIFLV